MKEITLKIDLRMDIKSGKIRSKIKKIDVDKLLRQSSLPFIFLTNLKLSAILNNVQAGERLLRCNVGEESPDTTKMIVLKQNQA